MSIYNKILANRKYEAPGQWQEIRTIDMHTGGEPLRVILDGYPELKGDNVLAYRRDALENFDDFRTALMFEPRGHADMYGCVLTPPNSAEADFGILFLHNEGYSMMCGHAVIAVTRLAVEMKWLEVTEGDNLLKIDAPCGRINAFARIQAGKISGIRFHCVPSFVIALDNEVEIDGFGRIKYDIAYGGAFYAYVEASQFNLELSPDNYAQLIDLGMQVKHAVMQKDRNILHPYEDDLSFLYGTIFIGESPNPAVDSRNVCIFAEGEVDRSPTGSGVAGRMAIHHARKELKVGESMQIESITGSVFKGSIVEAIEFGPHKAVVPEVEGSAYITGRHTFLIDPEDPFREGFILR
jgi:trans-L-3-hydroxyproline dehydratase